MKLRSIQYISLFNIKNVDVDLQCVSVHLGAEQTEVPEGWTGPSEGAAL